MQYQLLCGPPDRRQARRDTLEDGGKETAMAGYAKRVGRDIARWQAAGYVDAATAATLQADVDREARGGFSFGAVLSMLAAMLFAAAILIFVAANWETIPRLVRAGGLFALIFGGYVAGAFLKLHGRDAFGEGVWVCAAASFGAAIALVGQMYHLSGDGKQAVFAWLVGTVFAAVALRSGALTVGSALLAVAWMLMDTFDQWVLDGLPYVYPVLALLLYVLSFWTRSRIARHLLALSISLFVVLLVIRDEAFHAPIILCVAAAALLVFGHFRPEEARRVSGLEDGLAVQALIAFLTGIGSMQVMLIEEPAFLLTAVAAFAAIVVVLIAEGRENRALRWLAYAAFIFQLGFVYVVTIGSMMGTAGFFVLGGIALSCLSWLIGRLERRFSNGAPVAAGGAP
jgi:uncharacterized membrane protein